MFKSTYIDSALEKLNDRTEEERAWIMGFQNQFSNGFGNVNYQGALLTVAVMNKRKPYSFKPVVLKDTTEFKDFVQYLKQQPHPVRERFLIAPDKKHWISGDLYIDKNGTMNILFIDSLGIKKDLNINYAEATARDSAGIIAENFEKYNIYVTHERRQEFGRACHIYSFDDLIHLYTVEKYLDKEYKNKGLFAYLEDQPFNKVALASPTMDIKIKLSNLPIGYLRSMQDIDKLNTILNVTRASESNMVVNKKGQTVRGSLESKNSFQPKSETEPEVINKGLINKLKTITEHNLDFLLANSKDKVEEEMQKYTLAAYKNANLAKKIEIEEKIDNSANSKAHP